MELLLCQGDCTAEHPAETGCRDQKSVGITTLMLPLTRTGSGYCSAFCSSSTSSSWSQAGPCLRMSDVQFQFGNYVPENLSFRLWLPAQPGSAAEWKESCPRTPACYASSVCCRIEMQNMIMQLYFHNAKDPHV